MSVNSKHNAQKIRSLILVSLGILLIATSIAIAAEPRTRISKAEKKQQLDAKKLEAVQKDAKTIDAALSHLLSNINEQRYPNKKINALNTEILKTTKKSLKSLDQSAQCQYYMFQAWTDSFAGDKDRALKGSMKAYKTNPKNNDAKLTHIAMATLSNKKPVKIDPEKTTTTSNQKRSSRSRSRQPAARPIGGIVGPVGMGMGESMAPNSGRRGMRGSMTAQSTTSSSGDILQLDDLSLSEKLLDETVEPMQVDCLNATVFSYEPQDTTLCALIWTLGLEEDNPAADDDTEKGTGPADPNDAEKKKRRSETQRPTASMEYMGLMGPMGNMNSNSHQNDPMLRQMDAFGKLYANNFDNYATQFVAVNIDKSKEAKSEVLKETMKNPWPWAQIVGNEQAEKVGIEMPDASPGLRTAILLIADTTGSVRYAGPAEGFLAPLVIHNLAPKSQMPEKRKTLSAKPIKKEPAQAARTKTKKVQDEEDYFDPQAEKLLANAKGFIKIGRFTTYKKGINMCRQVINDYPNTKYEQQAREILRRVPERHRKKYRITDADLGQ